MVPASQEPTAQEGTEPLSRCYNTCQVAVCLEHDVGRKQGVVSITGSGEDQKILG